MSTKLYVILKSAIQHHENKDVKNYIRLLLNQVEDESLKFDLEKLIHGERINVTSLNTRIDSLISSSKIKIVDSDRKMSLIRMLFLFKSNSLDDNTIVPNTQIWINKTYTVSTDVFANLFPSLSSLKEDVSLNLKNKDNNTQIRFNITRNDKNTKFSFDPKSMSKGKLDDLLFTSGISKSEIQTKTSNFGISIDFYPQIITDISEYLNKNYDPETIIFDNENIVCSQKFIKWINNRLIIPTKGFSVKAWSEKTKNNLDQAQKGMVTLQNLLDKVEVNKPEKRIELNIVDLTDIYYTFYFIKDVSQDSFSEEFKEKTKVINKEKEQVVDFDVIEKPVSIMFQDFNYEIQGKSAEYFVIGEIIKKFPFKLEIVRNNNNIYNISSDFGSICLNKSIESVLRYINVSSLENKFKVTQESDRIIFELNTDKLTRKIYFFPAVISLSLESSTNYFPMYMISNYLKKMNGNSVKIIKQDDRSVDFVPDYDFFYLPGRDVYIYSYLTTSDEKFIPSDYNIHSFLSRIKINNVYSVKMSGASHQEYINFLKRRNIQILVSRGDNFILKDTVPSSSENINVYNLILYDDKVVGSFSLYNLVVLRKNSNSVYTEETIKNIINYLYNSGLKLTGSLIDIINELVDVQIGSFKEEYILMSLYNRGYNLKYILPHESISKKDLEDCITEFIPRNYFVLEKTAKNKFYFSVAEDFEDVINVNDTVIRDEFIMMFTPIKNSTINCMIVSPIDLFFAIYSSYTDFVNFLYYLQSLPENITNQDGDDWGVYLFLIFKDYYHELLDKIIERANKIEWKENIERDLGENVESLIEKVNLLQNFKYSHNITDKMYVFNDFLDKIHITNTYIKFIYGKWVIIGKNITDSSYLFNGKKYNIINYDFFDKVNSISDNYNYLIVRIYNNMSIHQIMLTIQDKIVNNKYFIMKADDFSSDEDIALGKTYKKYHILVSSTVDEKDNQIKNSYYKINFYSKENQLDLLISLFTTDETININFYLENEIGYGEAYISQKDSSLTLYKSHSEIYAKTFNMEDQFLEVDKVNEESLFFYRWSQSGKYLVIVYRQGAKVFSVYRNELIYLTTFIHPGVSEVEISDMYLITIQHKYKKYPVAIMWNILTKRMVKVFSNNNDVQCNNINYNITTVNIKRSINEKTKESEIDAIENKTFSVKYQNRPVSDFVDIRLAQNLNKFFFSDNGTLFYSTFKVDSTNNCQHFYTFLTENSETFIELPYYQQVSWKNNFLSVLSDNKLYIFNKIDVNNYQEIIINPIVPLPMKYKDTRLNVQKIKGIYNICKQNTLNGSWNMNLFMFEEFDKTYIFNINTQKYVEYKFTNAKWLFFYNEINSGMCIHTAFVSSSKGDIKVCDYTLFVNYESENEYMDVPIPYLNFNTIYYYSWFNGKLHVWYYTNNETNILFYTNETRYNSYNLYGLYLPFMLENEVNIINLTSKDYGFLPPKVELSANIMKYTQSVPINIRTEKSNQTYVKVFTNEYYNYEANEDEESESEETVEEAYMESNETHSYHFDFNINNFPDLLRDKANGLVRNNSNVIVYGKLVDGKTRLYIFPEKVKMNEGINSEKVNVDIYGTIFEFDPNVDVVANRNTIFISKEDYRGSFSTDLSATNSYIKIFPYKPSKEEITARRVTGKSDISYIVPTTYFIPLLYEEVDNGTFISLTDKNDIERKQKINFEIRDEVSQYIVETKVSLFELGDEVNRSVKQFTFNNSGYHCIWSSGNFIKLIKLKDGSVKIYKDLKDIKFAYVIVNEDEVDLYDNEINLNNKKSFRTINILSFSEDITFDRINFGDDYKFVWSSIDDMFCVWNKIKVNDHDSTYISFYIKNINSNEYTQLKYYILPLFEAFDVQIRGNNIICGGMGQGYPNRVIRIGSFNFVTRYSGIISYFDNETKVINYDMMNKMSKKLFDYFDKLTFSKFEMSVSDNANNYCASYTITRPKGSKKSTDRNENITTREYPREVRAIIRISSFKVDILKKIDLDPGEPAEVHISPNKGFYQFIVKTPYKCLLLDEMGNILQKSVFMSWKPTKLEILTIKKKPERNYLENNVTETSNRTKDKIITYLSSLKDKVNEGNITVSQFLQMFTTNIIDLIIKTKDVINVYLPESVDTIVEIEKYFNPYFKPLRDSNKQIRNIYITQFKKNIIEFTKSKLYDMRDDLMKYEEYNDMEFVSTINNFNTLEFSNESLSPRKQISSDILAINY